LEHQEVPEKEAMVETIRAPEDWYGDWHLAVGRRWQPKKQTQDNGGSWKKLATACRWMTRCAVPAWHKGCDHKGTGKDVAIGAPKGWTFRKTCRVQPECNNRTKERGPRQQLHLRKERTTGNDIREQSRRHFLGPSD
jgi:hypothetical protein